MTVRLSYSLERQEFVAALEAVVGSIMATEMHRKWARRRQCYHYIYYPVLAVSGILVVIIIPESMEGMIIFAMIILLAELATSLFLGWALPTQLGATFDSRRHRDVAAVFGPERASHVGREHEQSWKWTLLQRFHELPSVYVLEFAGFDMLVVPRRVFSSAEEAEGWAAGIRGRLAGSNTAEAMG